MHRQADQVVLLTNSDRELVQMVSSACGLPPQWSRRISEGVTNQLAASELCVCLIELGESAPLESTEQVWDQGLSHPLCFGFEGVRSALCAFRNKKHGTIVLLAVGTRGLAGVGQSFLSCLLRSLSLEGESFGVRAVGLACDKEALKTAWCRSLLRAHVDNWELLPSGHCVFLPSLSAVQRSESLSQAEPKTVMRAPAQSHSSRVVAITGAARGIGKAMARALAETGCKTALFDKDTKALGEAADELNHLGFQVCEVTGDAGKKEDLELLAETTVKKWGRLDAWINNAAYCIRGRIEEISPEQFERTLDVNLRSAWRSAQIMTQISGTEDKAILNMSSTAAFSAGQVYSGRYNAYAPYAASKAGLLALTRTVAREAAPFHLRVNALAPGPVLTELARNIYPDDKLQELVRHLPAGRLAMPEEVAAAARFLLSPEASLITGQVLVVDGGLGLQQM